jgi:4-aminobutyrate aminotransferase
MSTHSELHARHTKVLPSWQTLYYAEPIELVSGQGRHVTDAQGTTYLDFFGGILTTSTGHNVPEVTAAVQAQAARLLHSSTLYLNRNQIELAERIAGLSTIPDAKVFFVSSGTEANEAALLMATTARSSNQVLALRNSYHGRSFGAIAITGNAAWSPTSFSPLQVSYLASPDKLHSPYGPLTDGEFIDLATSDLRQLLATTTSRDVAALIAEPIQGVGGFVIPPDGYFAALKAVTDEHGILFIADEVQTGWGRTGEHFWGFQAHGITPDLITFAKGLGNGLAIGGVVGRPELIDAVAAASISTFGGNPLSTAGALANLNLIQDHNLQNNAFFMGLRLRDALTTGLQSLPHVAQVRGKGLLVAVELTLPGTLTPDPAAASAVLEATRAAGLLIGKGGLAGNVLRIAPALTVTPGEIDTAAAIIVSAVTDTEP